MDAWGRQLVALPDIFLYLEISLIILTILVFSFWYKNFKNYYNYLSKYYKDAFVRLMKKDKVIDLTGEWIRWPVGSAYLLFSIFNFKETYNDFKIVAYKRKSVIYFISFILLFIFALLLAKEANR